jgi:hypothetical protein
MMAQPRWRAWLQAVPLLCLGACQAPPEAPPQATPEWVQQSELVRGHLAELVSTQRPPCGAVLQYTRHDRLDYRVDCASGQAYRVHVRGDGRVVVTPYGPPRPASAPP